MFRISPTGICYVESGDPLAVKLIRLLDIWNRARASVLTSSRLPGIGLAIDVVQAHIAAERNRRKAA